MHFKPTTIFALLACLAVHADNSMAMDAVAEKSFTTTIRLKCGREIKRQHAFDVNEGLEQIAALEKLNHRLENMLRKGELTLEKWAEMGLVVESPDNHVKMTFTNKKTQKVTESDERFKEIRFPMAYTGAYLPAQALTDYKNGNFEATVIAMPGIGFKGSTAQSLAKPSSLLAKATSDMLPDSAVTPGKNKSNNNRPFKMRLISIPIDNTLNGMQINAPFAFASNRGVLAVTRHVDLYVRTRFPGLARYALGRSQGGLNDLEYGLHYSDVAAIALAPTPTDEDMIAYSIDKYENQGAEGVKGISSMKDVVARAWEAHHAFTPLYDTFRTTRPSLAPSLAILGKDDPSYPANYADYVRSWASLQPHLREVVELDVPEHEAIARHLLMIGECPETYEMTLHTMGAFINKVRGEMLERQEEWMRSPLNPE